MDAYYRDKNILDNIHRLPTKADSIHDCVYVFENISFMLSEGNTYNFPPNYRLKNCEVVGNGRLEFSSDQLEPDEPIVVNNENDLKNLFGIYCPEKSIVWNIKEAEKNGSWPKTGDVELKEMQLNEDSEVGIDLPINAVLNDCLMDRGILRFESGTLHVVGQNAAGVAAGPAARAFTSVGLVGSFYGEAYATGTGTSFSFRDSGYACADGPNSRVYGMKNGSIIEVKKGATGFKHVNTVNAKKDEHPDSKILMSAVHRQAPPPYFSFGDGKVYLETEKFKNYREYVVELKNLADCSDVEAARKLLAIDRNVLKELIPIFKSEDRYIDRYIDLNGELGSAEEALKACEHYMNRYTLKKTVKGLWWNGTSNDGKFKSNSEDIILIYSHSDPDAADGFIHFLREYKFSGNPSDHAKAKKFFEVAKTKGWREDLFGEYVREYQRAKPEEAIKKTDEGGCIIS